MACRYMSNIEVYAFEQKTLMQIYEQHVGVHKFRRYSSGLRNQQVQLSCSSLGFITLSNKVLEILSYPHMLKCWKYPQYCRIPYMMINKFKLRQYPYSNYFLIFWRSYEYLVHYESVCSFLFLNKHTSLPQKGAPMTLH